MRASLSFFMCGIAIFLRGGLMAEQLYSQPQQWTTIKDETGLQIDFPHHPLKLSFDVPFQNHPPQGQIDIYSLPIQKGLLGLSTFHSATIHTDWLQKERLYQFFETLLVPHFFYNPEIFQNQQVFNFQLSEFHGEESAVFQFSFQDHGLVKRLEGIALIKNQTLYVCFYLASANNFDPETLKRFLSSLQLPKN